MWRVCRRGSIKDNDNRQQGAILGGPEYSQTPEKHQLFHRQLMRKVVVPILWYTVVEYTKTPEKHQLFHPHPMNCDHIWALHTKYAHTSTQFLRNSFKEFVNKEQRVCSADADCDQDYQNCGWQDCL